MESKLLDNYRTEFIRQKLAERKIESNKTVEYVIPIVIEIINEVFVNSEPKGVGSKENILAAAVDTVSQLSFISRKLTKEEIAKVFNESQHATEKKKPCLDAGIITELDLFRETLEKKFGQKLQITVQSEKCMPAIVIGSFTQRPVEVTETVLGGESLVGVYCCQTVLEKTISNLSLKQNFLEINGDEGKCHKCQQFTPIKFDWCQKCNIYLEKSVWSNVRIDYDKMKIYDNKMGTWADRELDEIKYLGKIKISD